jgi:putative ABC transport system permease protein
MLAFALRSLAARRRRAAMTTLAVTLGVSMIAGTFVFTDTIHAAFRQLFTDAAKGADAIVSSRQDITSPNSAPASLPDTIVRRIQELPGVSAVSGQVSDVATIVGRDGKVIKSAGAPTLAFSYVPPPFGGVTFVKGAPPRGPNEVALDEATASKQGYKVGDRVPIVTGQPERKFVIAGIARLGGASLGGATFAVFSIDAAQNLYLKRGRVDVIFAAGATGTKPATLVKEIRPLLPSEFVVRTARGQVDNDVKRIGDQLSILTGGLLAFGFIAIFVGAFVIFNTFSTTVAQRTHEFALLRALGATGRQVRRTVLVEAAAIGLVASLAGLLGGLLAAAGIKALFASLSFNLPSTSLTFQPRTALVGLAVGILVTLAAGLVPAIRATRVTPLEALRESVAPAAPSSWRSRLTAGLAALLGVAGLVLIFTSSGTTSQRLTTSALGALALVLAIVVSSPRVIGRLTKLVGWPLERRGRILGRLARENAARNPTRTAATASSLMIGLALVLFVTVYANGLRTSTSRIIDRTLIGDFTIESQDGISTIPAASARAVAVVPDVLAVSSLKTASARLAHQKRVTAAGVDPTTIGQVYRFDWIHGSPSTLASLQPGDAIVERDTARTTGLKVNDRVTVRTETGLRTSVTIRGIYKDQALLRGLALPLPAFDALFHQQRLQDVFVKLAPGADRSQAGAALDRALSSFPGVQARSQKQLKDEVSNRVNSVLVLFYALLAMSVLMSLLGIVNTLTLSVHERTRELGMLRAVGMTRGQTRTLIRDESVITAAIGALVGLLLGVFFAWIMTRALTSEGIVFAIPWGQVALLLALGLLAGVIAAAPPARRAAKLDLLAAIAHE